jgi:hypothetical protein
MKALADGVEVLGWGRWIKKGMWNETLWHLAIQVPDTITPLITLCGITVRKGMTLSREEPERDPICKRCAGHRDYDDLTDRVGIGPICWQADQREITMAKENGGDGNDGRATLELHMENEGRTVRTTAVDEATFNDLFGDAMEHHCFDQLLNFAEQIGEEDIQRVIFRARTELPLRWDLRHYFAGAVQILLHYRGYKNTAHKQTVLTAGPPVVKGEPLVAVVET